MYNGFEYGVMNLPLSGTGVLVIKPLEVRGAELLPS